MEGQLLELWLLPTTMTQSRDMALLELCCLNIVQSAVCLSNRIPISCTIFHIFALFWILLYLVLRICYGQYIYISWIIRWLISEHSYQMCQNHQPKTTTTNYILWRWLCSWWAKFGIGVDGAQIWRGIEWPLPSCQWHWLSACVCEYVRMFFLASHIHGVMSRVWNVPIFGVVNACIPIVKLKNLVIKTTIMSGGKCQYEWYNFHFIETALKIEINSMWCVAIEMITNKTERKSEQEKGQKSSANYFRGLHCKWYAIYTRKRFYLWLKWWRLGYVCKEREKAMGDRMCDRSNGHGAYFLTDRTAKPSNNLIFYQYLLNNLSRLSD